MKRISIFSFALFFILLNGCKKAELSKSSTEISSDSEPSAGASKAGPSANGQGTLTVGDQTRHFSFHAMTASNGTVSGSGVLTYTAGGVQSKFDINCMTVVGNEATMSGVVTQSDNIPVGYPVWFKAVDNGEGANATEDQLTLLTYWINGAAVTCAPNYFGTPLNPIEGGNIQVKK